MAKLRLTRSELQNVNYQYLGAFRLRVEASAVDEHGNPTGADPNVFLYLRKPVNPYTGTADDIFQAICGPVDLSDYPIGEPDPEKAFPFLRLSYVELDLRATSVAEEIWGVIAREVNQLLVALQRMETLVPTLDIVVGLDETTGDSESESESHG
jgi:hypothetical protein